MTEALLTQSLPTQVGGWLISDLLIDLPGLLIVGPRASGKTTTARRHAKSIVHLDQDIEAEQFRADPDLHTGRHVYRLDDKIVAAPICTIWA